MGHEALLYDFPIVTPTDCVGVIQGPDGKFYGGTSKGGTFYTGTIFSMNSNGTGLKVLYNLAETETINAPPVFGPDGYLYFFLTNRLVKIKTDGTNFSVVAYLPFSNCGYTPLITPENWLFNYAYHNYGYIIFKVKTNGDSLQIIHTFSGSTNINLTRSLCLAPGGRLYGTTNNQYSWIDFHDDFFSLRSDGTDFTIHKKFTDRSEAGPFMQDGAVSYDNGKVFFSTQGNYINNLGQIYCYDTLTKTVSSLCSFIYASDSTLNSEIVARNNSIIGLSYGGIYKLKQDGTNFESISTTYSKINYQLSTKTDSLFYLSNDTLKAIALGNKSFQNVYTFGGTPNGYQPISLTKLPPNSIVGINAAGGAFGYGNVFKINNDGSGYKVLHHFTSGVGVNHNNRLSYSNGKLYGVISNSIVSLDTAGNNYKVIYNLLYPNTNPNSELEIGPDGFLYGFLQLGLYRVDTLGNNFKILKTFTTSSQGYNPAKAPVYLNNYLYGICANGGDNSLGTMFRVDKNGNNFIVHSFSDSEGPAPGTGLTLGADNKLYTVMPFEGAFQDGYIIQVNPDNLSVNKVYDFSPEKDGATPDATAIMSPDGRLYLNKEDRIFSINLSGEKPGSFTMKDYKFLTLSEIIEFNDNELSCPGTNTTLTSTLTGNNVIYEWQVNTGSGFDNITNDSLYSGVNTTVLSILNTPYSVNNYVYRCAVSNGNTVTYSAKRKIEIQSGWSGAVNDDWFNPLNWYCGQVPDNKATVTISAGLPNYPLIKQDVNCVSLHLQNGASLTVTNGAKVFVSGVAL